MHTRSIGNRNTKPFCGRKAIRTFLCSCAVFVALAGSSICLGAQEGIGSSGTPGGIRTDRVNVPSPINQPPDANAQLRARHRRGDQLNFDAANALRQQQITDEATKLLILARDLNFQLERLGGDPPSARLMREIEVIERIAHAVQQKMTLTVGAG